VIAQRVQRFPSIPDRLKIISKLPKLSVLTLATSEVLALCLYAQFSLCTIWTFSYVRLTCRGECWVGRAVRFRVSLNNYTHFKRRARWKAYNMDNRTAKVGNYLDLLWTRYDVPILCRVATIRSPGWRNWRMTPSRLSYEYSGKWILPPRTSDYPLNNTSLEWQGTIACWNNMILTTPVGNTVHHVCNNGIIKV
jgi:hypothetical protein